MKLNPTTFPSPRHSKKAFSLGEGSSNQLPSGTKLTGGVRRNPLKTESVKGTIGILRRESLDHMIPLNQQHIHFLLREYIGRYYNPVRTHQGIGRQTPILSEEVAKTSVAETSLISESRLVGLYCNYRKVA